MNLSTHFCPTQPWNLPRQTLSEDVPITPVIRATAAKSVPDCCGNVALINPPFTRPRANWAHGACGCGKAMSKYGLSPTSAALDAYDRAVVGQGNGVRKCQTSIPGHSPRPVISVSRKSVPRRISRSICPMARLESRRWRLRRVIKAVPAIRDTHPWSSNWTNAAPRSANRLKKLGDAIWGTRMVPHFHVRNRHQSQGEILVRAKSWSVAGSSRPAGRQQPQTKRQYRPARPLLCQSPHRSSWPKCPGNQAAKAIRSTPAQPPG
jgi:hypothetical protein